jgi:hypothetical protein
MKMRKIIVILIAIATVNCKAQSPVIDLQAWNGDVTPNMYIKDTQNVLDQFEGTWLYTSGSTSLKIVLVKKNMKRLGRYYEDLIIGEYQYIENGVEKFNSLNNLNAVYPNEYRHKIVGNHIPTTRSPFDEKTPGEIRLKLHFEDNTGGSILIRRKMVGTQPAIQLLRRPRLDPILQGEPRLVPIVPWEDIYTLIKQ